MPLTQCWSEALAIWRTQFDPPLPVDDGALFAQE
jgi:hypothetical protein